MKRIKGMHDIKTHGTLAREGRLASIAKDSCQINRNRGSLEKASWDGDIDCMIFNRSGAARKPGRDLLRDSSLEKHVRTVCIQQVQESIDDMRIFASEKILGAAAELQRLEMKLSRLKRM